ncbi:MAG: hypothetical protein WCI73_16010, partial [Phycisphaerae bacterium]
PGESLPAREAQLREMPMEAFTNGSEPFNGWFGRQSDGKVRTLVGMPREAAMVLIVNGLDSIVRLNPLALDVSSAQLTQAAQDNAARAAVASAAGIGSIVLFNQPHVVAADPAPWDKVPSLTLEKLPNRATAKLAYDSQNLYVYCDVTDPTPFVNEGKDFTRLFKTGDAVDLQICTDPSAKKRDQPGPSDLRVVIAQFAGKPAAVLMKAVDPGAPKEKRVVYNSPVGNVTFERVEVLADAKIVVKTTGHGYRLEAALPLAALGLKPQLGQTIRGDVGVIFSDAQGRINTARVYWSSQDTNLVSDLPQEARLYPATWGQFKFTAIGQ